MLKQLLYYGLFQSSICIFLVKLGPILGLTSNLWMVWMTNLSFVFLLDGQMLVAPLASITGLGSAWAFSTNTIAILASGMASALGTYPYIWLGLVMKNWFGISFQSILAIFPDFIRQPIQNLVGSNFKLIPFDLHPEDWWRIIPLKF